MRSKNKLLLIGLLLWSLNLVTTAETVWVTGDPASPAFLKSVLQRRGWSRFPTRALRPGDSWKKGDKEVLCLDWQPPSASVAALSDHPEKVERVGGLFSGGLTPLRPLVFQYYHLGLLEGPSPNLTLYVHNPGSRAAKVHKVKGVGKPSLDYFSTGHTNNLYWFEATDSIQGEFVQVDPGETVEFFRQPLPKDYVVSGTLGLTQLEGSPLQFVFAAKKSEAEQPAFNNLLKESDVHSRGFYPVAVQRLDRTYRIGQDPLKLAVGALRQQTFSGVRELRGDYGVTYDVKLKLENTTDREAPIDCLFNPRGGKATATIMVNGEAVEIGETEAFKEVLFHTEVLQAGESKVLRLRTIPEGASSYPIRLVIKTGRS